MPVGEGHARKWLNKVGWQNPTGDFSCQGQEAMSEEASKLAKLGFMKRYSGLFKLLIERKVKKGVQKPNKMVFDYYDRFENVFKQYSMKLMMTSQCFLIQL